MAIVFTTVLVLFIFVFGISGVEWNHFHIKYDPFFGYWKMPVTLTELKKDKRFVLAGNDNELKVSLYSHQDDPRFFLLFDTYENIAGVRTGYIKSDIQAKAQKNKLPFLYEYGNISIFRSGRYWDTDVWYTTVLFASPAVLKRGGRYSTNGRVADGVFVTLDGNWIEVATNECAAEKQGFTRQACFIGMGQHYFYKVTPSSDCKKLQLFFGLYNSGKLIGFGLVPFGSFTKKEGGKDWFEDVPRLAAKMIMPVGPDCVYDWTDDYGLTSLHVFFNGFPRTTLCPLVSSSVCKS